MHRITAAELGMLFHLKFLTTNSKPTMQFSKFSPSGGVLSPYLIGTWEVHPGIETSIFLANPTSQALHFKAVYFDQSGNLNPGRFGPPCYKDIIPPNGLMKIDSSNFVLGSRGAIKILSYTQPEEGALQPQSGLIGYEQKIYSRWKLELVTSQKLGRWTVPWFGYIGYWDPYSHTEAPLFQIPNEVLQNGELAIIHEVCP
ncbi:MAG: hypothetical protein ACKVT2_11255 [Saprospiraceae bacterium]